MEIAPTPSRQPPERTRLSLSQPEIVSVQVPGPVHSIESYQYPYLPPPGQGSNGRDHPLDPRLINCASRRRCSLEMLFHGIQAIVSTYAWLNIVAAIRHQSNMQEGHGSVTAWLLFLASAVSIIMAGCYFMLAWRIRTTARVAPSCQLGMDIESEGLVNINCIDEKGAGHLGRRPRSSSSCSNFLLTPRPRVWILLSLVILTLVASVLQGYRIRQGINCARLTEPTMSGFCKAARAAVVALLMVSLMWLVWFIFWFLASFCVRAGGSIISLGRGRNKSRNKSRASIGAVRVDNIMTLSVEQRQQQGPGASRITLSIERTDAQQQPHQLQTRREDGFEKNITDQLGEERQCIETSCFHSASPSDSEPRQQLSPISSNTNGLRSSGASVLSIDICTKQLFVDQAELFSVSLDDEEEGGLSGKDAKKDATHSPTPSPTQPSPQPSTDPGWHGPRLETHAVPGLANESASYSTSPSNSKHVHFAISSLRPRHSVGNDLAPKQEDRGLPRSSSMGNLSTTPVAKITASTASEPKGASASMPSAFEPPEQRQLILPIQGQQDKRKFHVPGRSKSTVQASSRSFQHLDCPTPSRSSFTADIVNTRGTRSVSLLPQSTPSSFSYSPRSTSLGQMTSKRLPPWFGPSRSSILVGGSSRLGKSNNPHRNTCPDLREAGATSYLFSSSGSGSLSSRCESVILSIDDQQRLQKFREGILPYPPPPPVSIPAAARISVSYFPDLEQAEKERILNGLSFRSTSSVATTPVLAEMF